MKNNKGFFPEVGQKFYTLNHLFQVTSGINDGGDVELIARSKAGNLFKTMKEAQDLSVCIRKYRKEILDLYDVLKNKDNHKHRVNDNDDDIEASSLIRNILK